MKLKNKEIRDIHQLNGLNCIQWNELSTMLMKDKENDEMELKCPILF